MRRARITYRGAYHHLMNRGIRGIDIFLGNKLKEAFIRLLKEKSEKLKMRLLAYCLMDNHYHLIIQNTSGKLSEFMKELNGHYGIYYRKKAGGKGHVFQGRYKSTLIQEGEYLKMAIAYVLLNPVRAEIVEDPRSYSWSSMKNYYSSCDCMVDKEFVEELFQSKDIMYEFLRDWSYRELPIKDTRFGKLICDEGFTLRAIKRFNRRSENRRSRRKRRKDYILKPAGTVIEDFKRDKGIDLSEINVNSLEGKRLRAELLVLLKDKAGLKYSEIIEHPLFRSLKLSSLGQTYRRAKKKMKEGS